MDKNISIVLSRETTEYRSVAQRHWNLTDEQMKGMHVHNEPPRALGGRNIPEHLYVCSPDMHQEGWHKGVSFPKLASEGGKLSAIVRRKRAKEIAGLSKEERTKLREHRKKNRESKKNKREKKAQKKLENLARLARNEVRKSVIMSIEELEKLQEEMVKTGMLLPDPAGLQLW